MPSDELILNIIKEVEYQDNNVLVEVEQHSIIVRYANKVETWILVRAE